MEFKGTKRKWSLGDKRKSYQFIDCKDQGWYEMARVVVKLDGELSIEGKANALLISKAPEMLEKLAEVKDLLEAYPSEAEMNLKAVEIRQLIKEATEL